MSYIGDFVSGANIVHKFTTRDFSTGAPFNSANAVAVVYKDGNATVFNTGVTLTAAYNNGVGLHELVINAANTTRYTSGNEYAAILSAGTVNSVSVANEVIATFSIENRGVKQVSGAVGSVTNNVTVGAIANNAITEVTFDQTAGSLNPIGVIDQGIAQNTAAANIKIRAAAPFASNEIVGSIVVVSTGTGRGQARSIISYNAANNTAQVDAWTTTPNATTAYKIFAGPPAPSTPPDVTVASMTANSLKQFFNVNTTANFNTSVAGSVVNEIATNSGGSAAPTVDQILGRLNTNLALGNQAFTLTGSVTGNVGNVTGNIGGNLAGSVGSVTGNVGAVTGNIGGNVAGSVGSVSANVNAAVISMANNVVTALSLNANAITGAKVASDVDIRNVTGNVAGTVGSVTGNVAAVTGNVGGNIAGSVGSVVGLTASDVGAIKAKTDNLPSDPADESLIIAATDAIMSRIGAPVTNNISEDIGTRATPAQVNAEVVDALATDTYAEPAQGTPASTATLANKIGFSYKVQINKLTQTNNTLSVFDASGATVDHKATVSDVNNVLTRGNMVTGP